MYCAFCEKIEAHHPGVTFHQRKFAAPAVVSFEPRDPVVPGHRLFVPVKHISRLEHDPMMGSLAFEELARHADKQNVDYNIVVNAGPLAGQSIFHMHVHYVPRREGDGLAMPWGTVEEQAARQMARAVQPSSPRPSRW